MTRFLRHIEIDRYGGFSDFKLGPLTSGLNVVFGPNEAGKSTLASFVGGVLYGWEDAHGVRNTYRPDGGGERSGALAWYDDADGSVQRLSRDEQGAAGDAQAIADVDKATYNEVFSFTADELRSLKGSSDVTARLLSAGTGTGTSPAKAFVEIEQRIASLTAPASAAAGTGAAVSASNASSIGTGLSARQRESVFQLQKLLEEKRDQLKEESAKTALLIQEDRELRSLETSRANTAERIDALNDEIENLVSWRTELAGIEQRAKRRSEELERLQAERDEMSIGKAEGSAINARLLSLDPSADRVLRDRLEEFAEKQEKLDRIVDTAKENSATSTAAYEALCELDDDEAVESRRSRNRRLQAVMAALLTLAFIMAGIPLFLHGRDINSLSISALGIGLVVAAVFLAAAAFFALFRQPQGAEALEGRRKDAQWVMLQDRKKLDACLAERADFEKEVTQFLRDAGLEAAEGSIRRARTLLDEARVQRADRTELNQRLSSIEMRIHAAQAELAELETSRERIAETASAQPGVPLDRYIDASIRTQTAQRDALISAANDMGQRFGELRRELDLARVDDTFDRVKLEYQQLRTRLRDAKSELIMLLLAKRMLERSIAEWEHQGQPEVYEQASRLLSVITQGAWVRVSVSPTGSLEAISADGAKRDPRHLSLGTCQQLYLALRIALLITVRDTGTCIPILADDILVHFDAARRRGAACALAELAKHRQVVVFTCHEETVSALREAASSATLIRL